MSGADPLKWGWNYIKPKIPATVAQVVDHLALSPQIKMTTVLGPPACRIESRAFTGKIGRELFDHIGQLDADLCRANAAVIDLIAQNAELIKRVAELENQIKAETP
jgi:hypothetical protein